MMNDDGRFGMSLGGFNDKVDAQDLRREWEEWHRAFELILQMRKIESQPEKLVTMLTIGGRGLQRIFYNLRPVADEIIPEPVKVPLMPPEVPEYDNAVKRLEKFFVGKRNERVELEVFRSLKQSNEESFNNFVLRLRAQAARCEFSDREETELLQQITMGARDEKVRDKGLENVMSLDEVITYAMNREILLKQREKQKPFCSEAELHSVSSYRPRERNRSPRRNTGSYQRSERQPMGRRARPGDGRFRTECHRCGSLRHSGDSRECSAREASCNNCGQRGHYARKCGNRRTQRGNRPSRREVKREDRRGLERHGFTETNSVNASESLEHDGPRRSATDSIAKVE
nr:uncharacterized protein LOC109411515 [Aedes albopictus]